MYLPHLLEAQGQTLKITKHKGQVMGVLCTYSNTNERIFVPASYMSLKKLLETLDISNKELAQLVAGAEVFFTEAQERDGDREILIGRENLHRTPEGLVNQIPKELFAKLHTVVVLNTLDL